MSSRGRLGQVFASRSCNDAFPHTPHADVIMKFRCAGATARGSPANSTTTTSPLPSLWAAHRPDLRNILDHPFGMQEAGGQFEVVSGSSHSDREVAVSQSNFQGLLDCQQIVRMRCVPTCHPAGRDRNHCRRSQRLPYAFQQIECDRDRVAAVLATRPPQQLQHSGRPVRFLALRSFRGGANQAVQDLRRDSWQRTSSAE